MATSPDDDDAERLANVSDDTTTRAECLDWLIEEMQKGGNPDTLRSDLIENGWGSEDADQMVCRARQHTSGARSALGARNAAARLTDPRARGHRTTLYAPSEGTAAGAGVILMIGRAIEWMISRETRRIRYRMKHGLCHRCGHDIKTSDDRCPECQTPIIRRSL